MLLYHLYRNWTFISPGKVVMAGNSFWNNRYLCIMYCYQSQQRYPHFSSQKKTGTHMSFIILFWCSSSCTGTATFMPWQLLVLSIRNHSGLSRPEIRAKCPRNQKIRYYSRFLKLQTEIADRNPKPGGNGDWKVYSKVLLAATAHSRTQRCRRPPLIIYFLYALLNSLLKQHIAAAFIRRIVSYQ